MKAEAKALLDHEHARLLAERDAAVAAEASAMAPSEVEGSASGKRRRPGEEPSSDETAEPPPVAVLAIDIETHGWIDGRTQVANWIGQFGKPAWTSQQDLEFSRVVQLGVVAFDASGRMVARRVRN